MLTSVQALYERYALDWCVVLPGRHEHTATELKKKVFAERDELSTELGSKFSVLSAHQNAWKLSFSITSTTAGPSMAGGSGGVSPVHGWSPDQVSVWLNTVAARFALRSSTVERVCLEVNSGLLAMCAGEQ